MAATTDRRRDAPVEGPGQDDIEPVLHETRDRIITGTVTVVPFLRSRSSPGSSGTTCCTGTTSSCSLIMYAFSGLGVTVGFHRLFTHRSFKTSPFMRGLFAIARLGRDRGAGHLLGRRPPQAPRVLRPAGRPAQPARRPRLRLARRAARPRPRARRLAVHPHAARQPQALRARPARRPGRPFVDRTFVLWALGGSWPPFLLGWLDRRRSRERPDRPAVGRRRAAARPAPRDVQHQLAVPLLRAQALRHRRRVAQPRVAVAHHVRRGVAQQPPRVPDVGRSRPRPLARSTSPPASSGRSRSSGWRGTSSGSAPSAWRARRYRRPDRDRHRTAARGDRRGAPRPAVSRRALGRHARSRPRTAAAGRRSPCAPSARSRTRCARRASSASAARTSRARSRSTTSTRVLDLLDGWKPPPLDLRAKAAARRGRRARDRPDAAAQAARERAAPGRPAPQPRARPARGPPPLRRRQRVLLAVPRRVDDVLVRDLLARRARRSRRRSRRSSTSSAASSQLKTGERLLDVGCGWGSFIVHAAREYGVHATGVTLSEPQAERARRRAEEAGVGDLVDVQVMDWRDLSGERFDKVASIGMVEHVGSANIDAYAARLASLLRPGGWLLNHGIARLRHTDPEAGPFSERYVFPDAAPLHVSRIAFAAERAGLVISTRRGLPRRLRRDAQALGRAPGRKPRARARARRAGAHAGLAAVPAHGAARLRDRVHRPLPGAGAEAGRAPRRAAARRGRAAARRAVAAPHRVGRCASRSGSAAWSPRCR